MPSTAVEVRSVSPRTVLAKEKAIAESASERHMTASNALPRAGAGFLIVGIFEDGIAGDMNLRCHRDRPQAGNFFIERPHFDANRPRPFRQRPSRRPPDRSRRRRRLLVRKAAKR